MRLLSSFEGRIFEPRHVLGWTLFTFSAGVVNAGAVVASNTVVTHITGNVTTLALDSSLALALGFVVALFIGGAMLATLLADSLGSRPLLAFSAPIALAVALLLVTAEAGKRSAFGVFGVEHELGSRTFLMLGLLAGAMGMVNAAVSAATNYQVRTTHLSGPATDFAGNVVRALRGTGRGTAVEFRWAALRLAMLVAFAAGAFVAARLSAALRYDVFVVGAGALTMALTVSAKSLRANELRAASENVA